MAVQYNNRLLGRTVMVLPASCPPQCGGYYGELQTQNQKSSTFPWAVGGSGHK